MKVEKVKAQQRQRQLGNVQKQLLNNYFLQKYTNIMTKITNTAQTVKPLVKSQPKQTNNKINFKKVILQKKEEAQNSLVQRKLFNESPRRQKKTINFLELSQRSNGEQQYNSIDDKTLKQLQQSIVNDLYKQSPTQLQHGFYKKLQIQRTRQNRFKKEEQNVQYSHNQFINITYDSEFVEAKKQQDQSDNQNKKYEQTIRQSIKRNFSNRKSRHSSPKKSAQKFKQSQSNSSKVSVQIRIHQPNGLDNLKSQKKIDMKLSTQRDQLQMPKGSQSKFKEDYIKQNGLAEETKENHFRPQIHFTRQMIKPIQPEFSEKYQPQNSQIQQEIQFIAPSSRYYQSQNPNFVEDTFRFQEKPNSQKDNFSESQSPFMQPGKQSNNGGLQKVNSKKSLRSVSKDQTQIKDSSQIQMSFVSRLSLVTSEQGYNIRNSIEKQLFENQMGPYQSALYNVLDLIEKYPRSGPVYAVGQRTLDDRKSIEQRKRAQNMQIQQYRKKIQLLKKKGQIVAVKGQHESVIKRNKLEILRLIRKLSTKL